MAKSKSKGIFRTEIFLAIGVLALILFLYFKFFINSHLRYAAQWTATYVHGAEVNIGALKLDLIKANLQLYNVQITNKDKPTHNAIQIKEIHLNMLWDGLLRGKYIVPDGDIKQVEWNRPRKRPGRLLNNGNTDRLGIELLENETKKQIEEQYDKTLFDNLATLASGTNINDHLKSIQHDSFIDKKVKELEQIIKTKQASWEKRIKDLPNEADWKALEKEARSLKTKTKDPGAIANKLIKVKELKDRTKKYLKQYSAAKSIIKADLKFLEAEVKQADQLLEKDLTTLKRHLKVPSLNPTELTNAVFAKWTAAQATQFRKYSTLLESYIPIEASNDTEDTPSIAPRPLGEGKNYSFPVKGGYPNQWVKKLNITSISNDSEWSGDVSGEITNYSNNPNLIGLPLKINLRGNFPKMKLKGLTANALIDHRVGQNLQNIKLGIDSLPIEKLNLTDSPKFALDIANTFLKASLDLTHQEGKISSKILSFFNKPEFNLKTKSPELEKLLSKALNNIPEVNLQALINGSWKDLVLNLRSNLGKALSSQLETEFRNRLSGLDKGIRERFKTDFLDKKTGLLSNISSLEVSQLTDITKRESAIKNIEKELLNIKGADGLNKEKLKREGERAIKDLKKIFKF